MSTEILFMGTQKRRTSSDPVEFPEFGRWFTACWADWEKEIGRRTTQDELANHLGISRPSVSKYKDGVELPGEENARAIARRFGDAVYKFLDFDKPEPSIPPDFELLEDRVVSAIKAAGVPMGSPDAGKILIDIVSDWLSMRKQNL